MVIIFVGRFDGSVIITSVGFDRVRTLHLTFISFSLLLPCDGVILWLLCVFGDWMNLGYEICLLDFVGF